MSRPLHDQASELLRQQADRQTLTRVGLDCHRRMLELGDSDRPEAIRHALAAASLFQRLVSEHGPQPDWLAIHDEQCCRHGAIWIHALITEGQPHEPSWCRQALELLERMQQHHSEPIAWAAPMRAALQRHQPPAGGLADLLHLHGFKCAGSTFIGSLEQATGGQVAYVEAPQSNQRLPWQRVRDHLATQAVQPRAITSHLITLPPAGALARLKVAFLRDPIARLASAYRFQLHVQQNLENIPFATYLEQVCAGPLANYQTRHLSPQEPHDWDTRQGWAARPELIDLQRPDLFVGLVERYDDSILALEHQLQQIDAPLDLAYPQRLNTTTAHQGSASGTPAAPAQRVLTATELDASLYRRVAARLDERLAAIPDLPARRQAFERRCQGLRQQPPRYPIRPTSEWTLLPATPTD